MSTATDRAIRACNIAAGEVGVRESPLGSNSGGRVREYQRATTLGGTNWPWCAAFIAWVWQQAGFDRDTVRAVCTASTGENCRIAVARKLVVSPRRGAAVVWCGTHVELLYAHMGGSIWRTIGGNTSDGVFFRTRDVNGTLVYAPGDLGEATVERQMLYWLEDLGAKYEVKGPWDRVTVARNVYNGLSKDIRQHAKVVQTGDDRWAIRIGQPRKIGPWIGDEGKRIRNEVQPKLERARGRELRPYRTTRMPKPPRGEALGKTT